jgi:alkyl hydroperoxide reductase subunit F
MLYDLVIIGGASSGLTAAIYGARKKLNTVILTEKIGGQSLLTDNIENYPGFKSISGKDLINKMREQVENLGVKIKEEIKAIEISKKDNVFEIKTENNGTFQAKSVVIATGKRPRHLNVPGEKEFTSKGVSFCSTCDAPLFAKKDVAVVGGGNAGLESAVDLTKYARKIYVLEFSEKILGDESTQEKLRKTGKIEFITNAATKEIRGETFVKSLIYEDRSSGEKKELLVEGVFVNIGQIPNTDFVKGFVELNEWSEVITDHRTSQTSVEGIFAAGDVTDTFYKQCIIAAGEGAKAALSAYKYINSQS